MDDTKTAVDSYAVALSSRPIPLRKTFSVPPIGSRSLSGGLAGGLSGFWSDLWDQGQQAIDDWAQSQLNQYDTSAHINAQNQAVAEMAAVLDAYHAHTISNAQAQQQIQAISSAFTIFCQKLGYPEALKGAQDVASLATQILTDLKREAATGTTIAGLSPAMIAVGLAVLYFVTRGRR